MASTQQEQEKSPSAPAADETQSSRLPRSLNGYARAATDKLVAELATRIAELEGECAKLREQAVGLESELARHRQQEELVSKTLLEATSHATTIREKAREEAELFLRKARDQLGEHAAEMKRAERERADAEHELARVRQLAHETQQGLAGFLTQTLEQLRPEPEPGEPQPSGDGGEPILSALQERFKRDDGVPTEDDALHPATTGEVTPPPRGA